MEKMAEAIDNLTHGVRDCQIWLPCCLAVAQRNVMLCSRMPDARPEFCQAVEPCTNLLPHIPHDLILDVSLDKPEPIPVECAVCKDELSKLAADYKEYKDKVSTMSGSAESLSEKYQHMEEELKSSNAARTVLQTQVDNLVEEKRVLAKQLGIHIN
eukprot:251863-Chlamydomonas_euryale.AAC.3